MNIWEYVENEEEALDLDLQDGIITPQEYNDSLAELYHEAREYEREEATKHYMNRVYRRGIWRNGSIK